MSEEKAPYDWTAYYRAAYQKEIRNKNFLAKQLSEVEAKELELVEKIGNIQNNRFWKGYALARRCYCKLKRMHQSIGKKADDAKKQEEQQRIPDTLKKKVYDKIKCQGVIDSYRQEVFRQKHPYLQMLAQQERKSQRKEKEAGENWVYIDGWKCYSIEDTDIEVLLWGKGMFCISYLKIIKSWFDNNNSSLFAYADEDYYWQKISNRMHPWFKPDWSPDTLLSFCYVGHMIAVRKDLAGEAWNILLEKIEKAGNLEKEAAFYDMCLHLAEIAKEKQLQVGHIEEVLFHNQYEWNAAERTEDTKSTANIESTRDIEDTVDSLELAEKSLQEKLEQGAFMSGIGTAFDKLREEALQRRGLQAHLETGVIPEISHVIYEETPTISVIIPSKDHPEVLEQCLASFLEKTEYDKNKYEWIVVDNGSREENRKKMEELQKQYGFLYLYEPMEFNFSAMCNLGAAKAAGDCLLFLNDDIEVIQKDWLRIMAGQAMQPHVGAVGAKLWYAGTEKIQHAGITNMKIGPSHKLITFPDDRNYYYGHNQVTYDMIGVTAACLLIERRKYEEVGGLDESMKVAYNDVDFCFKLIEAGYCNVLRNDAVLYHHESLSRGLDEEDEGKWDRLLLEKENLFQKHLALKGKDSYYHKNLVDNESNYTCNFKFDCKNNLKETKYTVENAGQLAQMRQNMMQLTVDRAEKQHKIHREEPDFFYSMGWSYLPERDNAAVQRNIVLQQEEGTFLKVEPFPWHRKDVEAILPMENNISLAGFVIRIKKENLQKGIWRIGMMATDLTNGKQYLTWSDKTWVVD